LDILLTDRLWSQVATLLANKTLTIEEVLAFLKKEEQQLPVEKFLYTRGLKDLQGVDWVETLCHDHSHQTHHQTHHGFKERSTYSALKTTVAARNLTLDKLTQLRRSLGWNERDWSVFSLFFCDFQ